MSEFKADLKTNQEDYALFLPALSGFYATYIGKQRHGNYVDPARIPAGFSSMEALNFLNQKEGVFYYPWCLYSAGHANLELGLDPKEDMVRTRDPGTFILGDSGGFQIAKGVWEGDWRADSGCDKAQKKRHQVLEWMEAYMDYGMGLDIPGWVGRTPRGRQATKISTYAEAMDASKYNFEYFIRHRQHKCKFLTVLQGDNHTQANQWYQEMKKYSDPKAYPDDHFNGWAMGSQNKCDIHLVLKRLVDLIYDGLLESGKQDWIHYLGTSKLEWAMAFTDIQRAIRKYHNPTLSISFDCASPFLATANGQVYHENRLADRGKWMYKMSKCVDDKKYATDQRSFRDAVIQDKLFPSFINSPVIDRCGISDICHYKPGDLNKIGKEGRTSWDSFSYHLLMGHNIYAHLIAVQDGNARYDLEIIPGMLIQEKFDRKTFRDLTDRIFSAGSHAAAMAAVDEHSKWYMDIVGSSANGFLGKKAMNAHTQYNMLFIEEEDQLGDLADRDDSGLDNAPLDKLELEVQNEIK
jgi:hypothetical protein